MYRSLLVLIATLVLCASAQAADSLPADNAKFQAVQRVYQNIARAFGEGRLPPRLVVTPEGADTRMIVAWSEGGNEDVGVTGSLGSAQEGYIAIEERVYDLFAKGRPDRERDDALAFILGHELAHYYLRHGWVGDFGNSFASLEVGKKMLKAASYDEVVRRETEADYFGGFYGYLAGYDTLGQAPRTLDLLYAEYRLPDKVPSYPTRGERKAIAERAATNLGKMIPLFEGANRLLIVERYLEAARLFDHLGRAFPSREMYNNAGVAYAMEALRLFRPGTVAFAYPFEFDAETRLRARGGKAKGLDRDAERRNRLLNQAADAFDKALQRDREYAVAKVNLAAVTSLLGDQDTALVLANQALELARRQGEALTLANAQVARGIAYSAAGNRDRALVDFAAARNSGSALAALNMAQLSGEKAASLATGEREASLPGEETIAGISPRAPFPKDKEVVTFILQGAGAEPAITLHARNGLGWERTLALTAARMVSVVATKRDYAGSSARGIALGAPLATLKERYGDPSQLVLERGTTWYLYRKSRVAFAVDRQGKVSGWLLYAHD